MAIATEAEDEASKRYRVWATVAYWRDVEAKTEEDAKRRAIEVGGWEPTISPSSIHERDICAVDCLDEYQEHLERGAADKPAEK